MFSVYRLLRFIKTYKNWTRVLTFYILRKTPINCNLRDGTRIKISCLNHILYVSDGFRFSYEMNGAISFPFHNKKLVFYGTCENGAIGDVYLDSELDCLDVEGKTVIDIGANIGDSSVYFAMMKAKKVLAIEPFPMTYNYLIKNISENNLGHIITPLNIALAKTKGEVILSIEKYNSVGQRAKTVDRGLSIKTVTVDDILECLNEEGIVLKIDCEGCEYDIFENIRSKTLRKVDEILIEYHYGRKDLISLLRREGFMVKSIAKKGNKVGLVYGYKAGNRKSINVDERSRLDTK